MWRTTQHATFLHAKAFHDLPPDAIRRVLAHEAGHLTLNTSDEGDANRWADETLKALKAAAVAAAAKQRAAQPKR